MCLLTDVTKSLGCLSCRCRLNFSVFLATDPVWANGQDNVRLRAVHPDRGDQRPVWGKEFTLAVEIATVYCNCPMALIVISTCIMPSRTASSAEWVMIMAETVCRWFLPTQTSVGRLCYGGPVIRDNEIGVLS